jgi:hypothetical protein
VASWSPPTAWWCVSANSGGLGRGRGPARIARSEEMRRQLETHGIRYMGSGTTVAFSTIAGSSAGQRTSFPRPCGASARRSCVRSSVARSDFGARAGVLQESDRAG